MVPEKAKPNKIRNIRHRNVNDPKLGLAKLYTFPDLPPTTVCISWSIFNIVISTLMRVSTPCLSCANLSHPTSSSWAHLHDFLWTNYIILIRILYMFLGRNRYPAQESIECRGIPNIPPKFSRPRSLYIKTGEPRFESSMANWQGVCFWLGKLKGKI